MKTDNKTLRVIMSGGGTAGHIYPAVATADALVRLGEESGFWVEVLFVGAEGKMEMERVPKMGYRIVGLPVAGLQRGGLKRLLSRHNLLLPFKVWKSMRKAERVVRTFRPDVAVGFGGYASGPVLRVSQRRGIPTVLQEQNSYAGLTNRILGKRADSVCVAYDGMGRFFPEEKIAFTGNPVREQIVVGLTRLTDDMRREGYAHFGLDAGKKTILVVGGSLGTRTLNRSVLRWLDEIERLNVDGGVQVIWQHGAYYRETVAAEVSQRPGGLPENVWRGAFVERMDLAYAVADVIVARAGAGTVSEVALVGRPVIFVPSPNVSEDHQTRNAMALAEQGAGLIVRDHEAEELVIPSAIELLGDGSKRAGMVENIRKLGRPGAARSVAEVIIQTAGNRRKYRQVYFIGIGGIGMSALARYFKHEGYSVAGYDRTPSPLTEALEKTDGIAVHYRDDIGQVPDIYKDATDTLVVYTPAVPDDMSELAWFRDNGFEVSKRSRVLSVVGEGKDVMAVAGTHGKTTTTTMVAWFNHIGAEKKAGTGSAFLGGISKNFHSNLVLGRGKRLAVEADEFDRSFLQLYPKAAVITSVDPDHLDIYGSYEAVKEAFEQFVGQIRSGGALVLKHGVELKTERTDLQIYRYGIDEGDFRAENPEVDQRGCYTFDLVCPDRVLRGCRLGIPGLVNVENCIGAVALVWQEGFDDQKIRDAIATFSGVGRRFDFWVNERAGRGIVYMDDYAHHPEELRAMLTSVKKMFPGRKLTVVFQPHLYTRTKDFASGFSEVLGLSDQVLLLPVYPARELPIEGVDSELILRGMSDPSRAEIVSKEELLKRLADMPLEVLVTAGAGDIDRFCKPVADLIRERNAQS